MTDTILVQFHRGLTQALEEAITALARHTAPGSVAPEAEFVVQQCLEGGETVSRVLRRVADALTEGQFDPADSEDVRQLLVEMFATRLDLLRHARDWAHQFEQGGSRIGAANLDRAVEEAERLRSGWLDHWPQFSEQDVQEARAEYERGEYLDVDDAFAEIAGVSREAWLQHIEEHKRRKSGGQA